MKATVYFKFRLALVVSEVDPAGTVFSCDRSGTTPVVARRVTAAILTLRLTYASATYGDRGVDAATAAAFAQITVVAMRRQPAFLHL